MTAGTETLRLYLAAAYSRRAELAARADVLRAYGIHVGAEWLRGPDQRLVNGQTLDHATEQEIESRRFATPRAVEYAAMCAEQDLTDVATADVVVMFTGGGRGGGRHVEVGYALALGKRVLLVGPRENVFHCHPLVWHVPDWPAALGALVGLYLGGDS